jgi:hypothetical protein
MTMEREKVLGKERKSKEYKIVCDCGHLYDFSNSAKGNKWLRQNTSRHFEQTQSESSLLLQG